MASSATAQLELDATDSDVVDGDVELMLRTKDGDHTAFTELFERYSRRLVSFASRIVRDRWRAEELVQDAFLQIYRARDRYSPCARFSTYIYRVVTNNCLNEIRRQDREKKVPEEPPALLANDTTPQPDNLAMDRQLLERIAKMVADLPFKQRAALLLSRVEGFDHREVASCIGVSEFAVKSLVFRATRTLREGMGNTHG
jgi:RNA polymerase sigma-70 factor, ECF subfamily